MTEATLPKAPISARNRLRSICRQTSVRSCFLQEANILIKMQHNCVSNQTQYSGKFIPILHEYVLIVRKDSPVAIPVMHARVKTIDIRDMNGATWRDIVAAVLEEHHNPITLSELYDAIADYKKAKSNQWWREKVRQTLQNYPEHFKHVSRGVWCLQK